MLAPSVRNTCDDGDIHIGRKGAFVTIVETKHGSLVPREDNEIRQKESRGVE